MLTVAMEIRVFEVFSDRGGRSRADNGGPLDQISSGRAATSSGHVGVALGSR